MHTRRRITLLLNSEGKKMGKTQSGAVWLDPNKTSPFDFYQYWRNVADADVLKYLRMLTFLPLEQIDEMDKWEGSQLQPGEGNPGIRADRTRSRRRRGEEGTGGCARIVLFGKRRAYADGRADGRGFHGWCDRHRIPSAQIRAGREPPEGRRAVEQGGVAVDGEKITDPKAVIAQEKFNGEGVVVEKEEFPKVTERKKNFRKVTAK